MKHFNFTGDYTAVKKKHKLVEINTSFKVDFTKILVMLLMVFVLVLTMFDKCQLVKKFSLGATSSFTSGDPLASNLHAESTFLSQAIKLVKNGWIIHSNENLVSFFKLISIFVVQSLIHAMTISIFVALYVFK